VSDEMTPAEALSERVAALTAEVQRLRGVVEAAYYEGREDEARQDGSWKASDAFAALTPPAADTEGK